MLPYDAMTLRRSIVSVFPTMSDNCNNDKQGERGKKGVCEIKLEFLAPKNKKTKNNNNIVAKIN